MLYSTHVKVHLDHIRDNMLAVRKAVGADRKILVPVKGNGYGHGAVRIGKLAEENGIDWLGVATVPEGIQLRQAGVALPIMKFSQTFPEEMLAAVQHQLTLPVYDQNNVNVLQDICSATGQIANVHLKVDTGMGRVGVAPEEAALFAAYIEEECPNLRLEGVFTHFPVSDIADRAFTSQQIELFKSTINRVEQAINRKIDIVHCANSGAVLAYPEAWFDMVRPGIMIYGYYPDAQTPRTIDLKPGMSFYSRVGFMKHVKAGTTISYGRTWAAPRDTWIASLMVGYADGFNRLFSNRGRVLIKGKSYPIVGRVCMDQTMVDLGPETDVEIGDQVVLIGRSGDELITCEEWAEKLGTITYEVTCQIAPRVQRYYTD